MDLIGKQVYHKIWQNGVITRKSDNSDTFWVKFASMPDEKKFQFPSCFKTHLQLLDKRAAVIADSAIKVDEENSKKKAEEKRIQAIAEDFDRRTSQRASGEKDVIAPTFSTMDDFYNEQERVLTAEIACLRENGGKRQRVTDGKLIETKSGQYVYSFMSDSELNLPDNTQITIWRGSKAISAVMINCEDYTVIIASPESFGQEVSSVEFSAEPWRLLAALIERIKTIREFPSPIVNALVFDGRKNIQFGKPIQTGQDVACQMALSQRITFIWGPPGTGKTETLAKIAHAHITQKHRVLMLAHSNVSVDEAINRVFKKDRNKKPGKLVRYGYPRDKELLKHPYITTYNLALLNHPDLLSERTRLLEEKKHLSRSSSRYVEVSKRLTKIRELLDIEEKRILSAASFIATTVSKAIMDRALYESRFDVVIFDEASMAYIPQIVFASGLAKSHFICMGDFSQLPPIVQSSDTCSLNADIFMHCRIVDAVRERHGHEWLCLLDTQYRMHPEIADFSSKNMYHSLLVTPDDMAEQRKSIVDSAPMKGSALCVVDLSGMMSVCTKTSDSSRINVLSALIAMSLAAAALKHNKVGVITPYNAQSRLLHAFKRDIDEFGNGLHPIKCATVHQFQGSEMDVIIFDAVDCYRAKRPGVLLSSNCNNYANRLFNVALTRAKGKMLSLTNVAFMKRKSLSQNLMFRKMLDQHTESSYMSGEKLMKEAASELFQYMQSDDADRVFNQDISSAEQEIRIDIPGQTSINSTQINNLICSLDAAKSRGVRVYLRSEYKDRLPIQLQTYAIQRNCVLNPICIIDKNIVWFGEPLSNADFISEGVAIKTRYRPIIRYVGKHAAIALYGFLSMNQIIDEAAVAEVENQLYTSFASYINASKRCFMCGKPLKLRRNRTGGFFLSCSTYPKCVHSEFVQQDMVESYFSYCTPEKRCCPQDGSMLEARKGRYGVYVSCNGMQKHTFRLDEI